LVTVLGGRALGGGRLSLRDRGTAKAPLFAITPSQDDGGYDLARIPATGIQRRFCIRPVHAEVGHTYKIEVVLQSYPEEEPARRRRPEPAAMAAPVMLSERRIEVQARPEVYAAIGAVETLRDGLLKRYGEWVNKGRKANKDFQTMLPRTPSPDAVHVALGERSFEFLMQALDLGLRVVQTPAQRPPRRKAGDDTDGAPPS
jgi:hypothetical protein